MVDDHEHFPATGEPGNYCQVCRLELHPIMSLGRLTWFVKHEPEPVGER